MKISIVIPVYNEGQYLDACLEAIAKQTLKPYEVIVVDNNSTDDTVAIAASYPFVTVLHEQRQGVVYARDLGFKAASGDIIGRLDADSIASPDWVAYINDLFKQDTKLTAVTGKVSYYGLSLSPLVDAVDLRIRRRMARLLGKEMALQGANMALRRTSWQQLSSGLCRKSQMHEDFDLAVHLSISGHKVIFNEGLKVAIDCRRLDSSWGDFCKYYWLCPKTYAQHGLKSQRHMYPVVCLVVACYVPLRLLHRSFNSQTEKFSWRQLLLSSSTVRVNPATFVD